MTKQSISSTYENNPFFIALNGMQLLFKHAQSVAIYAAILAGLGLVVSTVSSILDTIDSLDQSPSSSYVTPESTPVDDFSLLVFLVVMGIIVVIALVGMLISFFLYGILEYTAAHLAKGEKVTLEQALKGVGRGFLGYFWVNVITLVKIFLWSLLLIIPGIIMSVRYMLAGTVYFAEGKQGNAAIKRSLELTKGAWFTTFAGFGLWNFITLGALTPLVNPGAATILYRQLKEVTDNGSKKPATHWLSWLTFFGPIALFVIFISFLFFIFFLLWLAAN